MNQPSSSSPPPNPGSAGDGEVERASKGALMAPELERLQEPPKTASVGIHRVRKAYEQVADQLRELIMSGELARGDRLPNETILAGQFGVSRGTVREALRVLAAQNLIRTAKGAGGGSFVTLPTADHISDFLHANIGLLSESEAVSLHEFLEARALLEVPAARLAAERRSESDIATLKATIVDDPVHRPTDEQFDYNKGFHSAVMGACGNTLLYIAAQPIFLVLQTNLSRSSLDHTFHQRIHDDHERIAAAIEQGDPDAAESGMQEHLAFLRGVYEKIWRTARS
jgi:GntR family transcriptional repressor for pyruvate dehydrogenase complex